MNKLADHLCGTELVAARIGPEIRDVQGWIPVTDILPPLDWPVLAVIVAFRVGNHVYERSCPRVGVAVRRLENSWYSCWPVGGSLWSAVVTHWLPIPGVPMHQLATIVS